MTPAGRRRDDARHGPWTAAMAAGAAYDYWSQQGPGYNETQTIAVAQRAACAVIRIYEDRALYRQRTGRAMPIPSTANGGLLDRNRPGEPA